MNKENIEDQLLDFISTFGILGLAIGSVLGTSTGKLSERFTDDILLPIIYPIFGFKEFKSFVLNIGLFELKVGNFISELIIFFITLLTLYGIIGYLLKPFLKEILKRKNLPTKKMIDHQLEMIEQLKKITKDNYDYKVIVNSK